MSQPGSLAKGILNFVYMVARTRGVRYNSAQTQYVPAPIVQNFNITPKMTVAAVGEFGTPNNIITYQDYENVEVAFDIYETDVFYLYAALMDVDPLSVNMMEMPELFYKSPITIFGNQVHMETGNIMTGFVVTDVLIHEATETQDLKNVKKIAFKGTGTLYRKVLNGAIDYVRGNYASPPFATPYGKTFVANVITTNYTPVNQPLPGSNVGSTSAQNYAVVLQNSVVMPPTGVAPWSISGTSFIVTNTGASTDYWDVFVPVATHAPYASGNPD